MPEWAERLRGRFGLQLVEVYGSADAGICRLPSRRATPAPGACGRRSAGYEVRILDAATSVAAPARRRRDRRAAARAVADCCDGYLGMPEATDAGLPQLWFHTGDLGRHDDDGYLDFVGRTQGRIRRRGENISAFEVEEVLSAPGRRSSAPRSASQPSSPRRTSRCASCSVAGGALDPPELIAFCASALARSMVPRYIEFVAALPKTPTEKVEKYLLARPLNAATWDREAA